MGGWGLHLLTGVDGHSNDKGCRIPSLSVRLVEGYTDGNPRKSDRVRPNRKRAVGKNDFKIP